VKWVGTDWSRSDAQGPRVCIEFVCDVDPSESFFEIWEEAGRQRVTEIPSSFVRDTSVSIHEIRLTGMQNEITGLKADIVLSMQSIARLEKQLAVDFSFLNLISSSTHLLISSLRVLLPKEKLSHMSSGKKDHLW
jgi:hypothetical protein